MPDIGATLREARMARRLDITEVEAATKIRAKYLRALENEEWDLLPGPTFVRTFLRTYGDYLELDSRMLVEDYKQSFQRPSQQDLLPFGGAARAGGRGRSPRGGRGIPPVVLVGLVVIALLAVLFALGTLGGDGDSETAATPTPTTTATSTAQEDGSESAAQRRRARRREAARKRDAAAKRARNQALRFQAVATGDLYVCVVNATTGETLIDGETLSAGQRTRTITSKHLKVTFGNSSVDMRINGRAVEVADSSPVGYDLVAGKDPERLPAAGQPSCG